tara:strand:+ start:6801 stop:7016 length:216 start_codon:yes stop_codon:yes gene_type:complete
LYRFCFAPAADHAAEVKTLNLVARGGRFLGPKIRIDPPETDINKNIAVHYWRIGIPHPPLISETRAHRRNG